MLKQNRVCRWTRTILLSLALVGAGGYASAEPWNSTAVELEKKCPTEPPYFEFELSSHYSFDNAYLLLMASSLADNSSRKSIVKNLRTWGFEREELISPVMDGAYGFIAERPEFILLTFRGTSSISEGLWDMHFWPESFESVGLRGKGHLGFRELYSSTRAQVNRVLEAWDPTRSKAIVVAGHSLGGAIALFHALGIAQSGRNLTMLYTTGQPRVGDQAFNEQVESLIGDRYYRMESQIDPIPRLPPTMGEAQAFGNLFAQKEVNKAFYKVVNQLRFKPNQGLNLRLEASSLGELEEDQLYDFWPELMSDDPTFYESMAGTLSQIPHLKAAFDLLLKRIDEHMPEAYVCAFLRGYNQYRTYRKK